MSKNIYLDAYKAVSPEAGIYSQEQVDERDERLDRLNRIRLPFDPAIEPRNSAIEVQLPDGKTKEDIVEIYDERIDEIETGVIEFKDKTKMFFKLAPFYDFHANL